MLEEELTITMAHEDPQYRDFDTSSPVIKTIYQQSLKPPGNDPYIGAFYSSFVDFIQKGNLVALDLIHNVQSERSLTPELHTNLLFRAIQERLIENEGYPEGLDTKESWDELLTSMLVDSNDSVNNIRETLLSKDTSTTVYQRYAGERALMALLADHQGVSIADIGCGGNYGLPGMEIGEEFKPIVDHTPNNLLTRYIHDEFNVNSGLAVDLYDPNDSESIAWRHACGVYPSELINGELNRIKSLEERLAKAKRTTFKQANLLELDQHSDLPFGSCDFVLMNTMLYQLAFDQQRAAIEQARLLLKTHGALFIQDFAIKHPKDPTQLQFDNVSWGEKGAYRLFVTNKAPTSVMYEAIRWNNGRCNEAWTGEDFHRLKELHPFHNTDIV